MTIYIPVVAIFIASLIGVNSMYRYQIPLIYYIFPFCRRAIAVCVAKTAELSSDIENIVL